MSLQLVPMSAVVKQGKTIIWSTKEGTSALPAVSTGWSLDH